MNERLYSLDAFRGLTVAAMILVNNPGDWSHVYAPLLHAKWHGCTPTDLIFPFFLFIVGISIHFAYRNKKNSNDHRKLISKIGKRSLIIFLLGILLAWYTLPIGNIFTAERFSGLRIPGVLQRISVVFFVAAILYIKTNWVGHIRWAASLLLGYYALMTWVPVPGVGAPNLEPETNLGAWVDRLLLDGHLWAQSKTWDPEGVLSTVPAIASAIIGMLIGQLFSSIESRADRATWLFFTGGVMILAGLAWSLFFPLNKALWTSSFVLYTAGIGTQLWAAFFWLCDVQGIKNWSTPLQYFGTNAIFAFVASGLLVKTLSRLHVGEGDNRISWWAYIYEQAYASWLSPYHASLLFAISLVALFLLILRGMHKRGIIVKV